MSLKFLSMAEKLVVPEETKKVVPKPIDAEFNPTQLQNLISQRTQELQARIDELYTAGFTSQIEVIRKRIESECTNEITKAYGFKKVKNVHQAFNSWLFKNSWDAVRYGESNTTTALYLFIASVIIESLFLMMAHFGSKDGFFEFLGVFAGAITCVMMVISSISFLIQGEAATDNTTNRSWQSTEHELSPQQTVTIQRAVSLNIFNSISIETRLQHQFVVIGRRNDSIYKIA